MEKDNKFVYIFIGVALIMVFGVIFYIASVFSTKDSTEAEISVTKSEMLSKDSVNINADRVNSYTEKDSVQAPSRINIDWSKMNLKVKKKPTEETNTVKEEPKENHTKPKTYSGNTRKVAVQKDTAKVTTVKEEPKKDESGGFGVILTNRTAKKNVQATEQNTVTQPAYAEKGGFFSAVLEEDTQIKNGSSVVFYLIEDCVFNDIHFKKNSICYGKAFLANSTFEIHINQIMNTDNRMFSTRNVFVFDEKYSRGLSGEGKLNEAVREGTTETTSETSGSIGSVGGGSPINGANLAVKTLNNTLKAITKKKEPVISLFKGYKVYLKQD